MLEGVTEKPEVLFAGRADVEAAFFCHGFRETVEAGETTDAAD